jgi:hypothetical protein
MRNEFEKSIREEQENEVSMRNKMTETLEMMEKKFDFSAKLIFKLIATTLSFLSNSILSLNANFGDDSSFNELRSWKIEKYEIDPV